MEFPLVCSAPSPATPASGDDLTPSQRAAVEHFEGPLLVLAGPGSGKTRVITRRIARLVERGVSPREILAITFTNKAAREMAERVQRLLPGTNLWVSTFHRFCARLLRERGNALGLQPNFTIYDTSDQHNIIKQALHDLDLDAAVFPPGRIGHQISQAKNDLISPEQYLERYGDTIGTHFEAVVAKVYPAYQKLLLSANAVDFDDLLVHVARLLREHDDLRAALDQRYRFILVDEYQDTNRAQYQIVAQLSRDEQNLCATGDPDQSIYGWRGAQIENILRFEQDFPDVSVIRLEDNFRSTPEILSVADQLIGHNRRRKPKQLRTGNASGEPVELRLYADGRQEAEAIASEIRTLVDAGKGQYGDFAIFYRVNALSRSLETALMSRRVPYQVAGAVSFYERSEIKDLVSYLRLIENPQDRVAFLRVVNTPPRGLGRTTVDRLLAAADAAGVPALELARRAGEVGSLTKRAVVSLRAFTELLDELSHLAAGPIADLLRAIVVRTGYGQGWANSEQEDAVQRQHNVLELISAAAQYDAQAGDERSLTQFLETTSLVQDADALEGQGAVTLMTLHAAKGLEFPYVYLIAIEQNLLPHERSLRRNDERELEEERRLMFVGLTRAEKKLVLTHTLRRGLHGRDLSTIPSDFLQEIPVVSTDCTHGGHFYAHEARASDRPSLLKPEWLTRTTTDDAEAFEGPAIDDAGDEGSQYAQDEDAGTPGGFGEAIRPTGSRPHLTTGAALEAGRFEPTPLPIGFAVGMYVRHPRYGLGQVTAVSGFARRRMVTVHFESQSEDHTFVADKSPLQPVGLG